MIVKPLLHDGASLHEIACLADARPPPIILAQPQDWSPYPYLLCVMSCSGRSAQLMDNHGKLPQYGLRASHRTFALQ